MSGPQPIYTLEGLEIPSTPLKEALCRTASPLVEGMLLSAIMDCPPEFAESLAASFSRRMLADRIIAMLQRQPELLEHLYHDMPQS